jgi:hypothetical protein
LEPPTPARSSRLKHRVGVAGATIQSGSESQAFSLGIEDTITEPPVKKFKALPVFDASSLERESLSSTQTETQLGGSCMLWSGSEKPGLSVLQEEESNRRYQFQSHSTKGFEKASGICRWKFRDGRCRTRSTWKCEGNWKCQRRRKERRSSKASEHRAASKPPSSAIPAKKDKQGAAFGKPDTDAAFLKAIASTKRGKKAEDKFDREFNNIEEQQEPEEGWAADFGNDTGLRGNFMVVVELDVYKKDKDLQNISTNHAWAGKPNFRKFKKVLSTSLKFFLISFLNFQFEYLA